MADEKTLGRLPKWPRKALNNSVIAAEQAYRKRSGLPLLSDADVEALRAGVQMSWENGDGAPAPPSPTVPATAPVVASPAVAAPTPAAGFSADVQKWLAAGKKWSKSAIAAEQARHKRNNLPALTDAEVTALLGEPAGTAPAAATPASSGTPSATFPTPTRPSRPLPTDCVRAR